MPILFSFPDSLLPAYGSKDSNGLKNTLYDLSTIPNYLFLSTTSLNGSTLYDNYEKYLEIKNVEENVKYQLALYEELVENMKKIIESEHDSKNNKVVDVCFYDEKSHSRKPNSIEMSDNDQIILPIIHPHFMNKTLNFESYQLFMSEYVAPMRRFIQLLNNCKKNVTYMVNENSHELNKNEIFESLKKMAEDDDMAFPHKSDKSVDAFAVLLDEPSITDLKRFNASFLTTDSIKDGQRLNLIRSLTKALGMSLALTNKQAADNLNFILNHLISLDKFSNVEEHPIRAFILELRNNPRAVLNEKKSEYENHRNYLTALLNPTSSLNNAADASTLKLAQASLEQKITTPTQKMSSQEKDTLNTINFSQEQKLFYEQQRQTDRKQSFNAHFGQFDQCLEKVIRKGDELYKRNCISASDAAYSLSNDLTRFKEDFLNSTLDKKSFVANCQLSIKKAQESELKNHRNIFYKVWNVLLDVLGFQTVSTNSIFKIKQLQKSLDESMLDDLSSNTAPKS